MRRSPAPVALLGLKQRVAGGETAVGAVPPARLTALGADFADAFFFGNAEGAADVPRAARSALVRDCVRDLRARYGGSDGALLAAEDEGGRFLGCVGVQLCAFDGRTILGAPAAARGRDDVEIRPLLANLAVAPEARRKGVARRLMAEAEALVRDEWGYDEILLQVETKNSKARSLYGKLGYRKLWRESGTAIKVLGSEIDNTFPVQVDVLRKRLGGGGGGGGLASLLGIFGL